MHPVPRVVFGLGRGRVEIWSPDPTPIDNPYPSYSGRVLDGFVLVSGRESGIFSIIIIII